MKNRVKNAGFKPQKELSEYLGVSQNTMCIWLRNPSRLFREWLELMEFKTAFDNYKRQVDEKTAERLKH